MLAPWSSGVDRSHFSDQRGQAGIVPVRRAEGDADLPEGGQVQADRAKRGLVDQTGASWNRVTAWLRQIEGIHKTP